MTIPILTPAESASWDEAADAIGIARATLMESAGRASAAVLAARYGAVIGNGVVVAAGPGNNGGDGWVLARALHRAEIPVWVAPLPGQPSPLNTVMMNLARAEGVREVLPDGPWPGVALAIDAILGTGALGEPRPAAAALLDRLRDLRVPIVALDGPTGVDLGTGTVHGAARADLSITFGGLRRGHLLAREQVGVIVVVDIGLPSADPGWPVLWTDAAAAEFALPFRAGIHKGDRGRVVVVGGDSGMTGALRLAARAAFGAGAGLVHAVAPEATVAALTAAEPDLQTFTHAFDNPPTTALLELVQRADAVIVGPGLGRSPTRRMFIAGLLTNARSIVLDADGLNAFANVLPLLADLARGRAVLLTPHPGEFRTLFPHLGAQLDTDPWAAAEAAAAESGATVLLKGVPSVVARAGQPSITLAAGTPGLATGGSGDVLSGLAGAALGQGIPPERAAAFAAQALGRAGELAARRVTARAMRPMDVIEALPDVWRAWAVLRTTPPTPKPPVIAELERPEQ
jgi:ADP-dependent NAD(P)H-hydrate dehydratase / NAD(P)H-hydrate epimerase